MRLILAIVAIVATAMAAAAQTPLQRCKAIADSLERLKCFDAIEEPAAPAAQAPAPASQPPAGPAAKSTAAAEDPLIGKAKASVLSQLRHPDSAKFVSVKVRTVRGKQGVCGSVNAKNAMGFLPGPQPFAFDGEQAHLIVYNPGPANITNQDGYALGADMRNRLKAYSKLCR